MARKPKKHEVYFTSPRRFAPLAVAGEPTAKGGPHIQGIWEDIGGIIGQGAEAIEEKALDVLSNVVGDVLEEMKAFTPSYEWEMELSGTIKLGVASFDTKLTIKPIAPKKYISA